MDRNGQRLQTAFSHVVRDTVRPLAWGFGLFITYNAIKGIVRLSGTERLLVAGADVLVGVLLFAVAAWVQWRPPPDAAMNRLGAGIGLLLAFTDMVTMAVDGHVPAFPATALVLAGIGAVVLSWRWCLITQGAIWIAWIPVTQAFTADPWAGLLILQASTITGLAIHWGRLKAYTSLVKAREQEADARRELQRVNDELDRFTGVVAHDLKNPLSAFRLKLAAIKARSQEAKVQDSAMQLDRMAKDMQGLIEDLLAYATAGGHGVARETATLEQTSETVASLYEDALNKEGGCLHLQSLPAYSADATLLRQLLQNLVGNALLYCGDRPPDVRIGGTADEDAVEFWVEDRGVGFDPEDAERLFRPFQRGDVDAPGHGLGLATCARIVHHLGGRIEATSRPGHGARFTVRVPQPTAN